MKNMHVKFIHDWVVCPAVLFVIYKLAQVMQLDQSYLVMLVAGLAVYMLRVAVREMQMPPWEYSAVGFFLAANMSWSAYYFFGQIDIWSNGASLGDGLMILSSYVILLVVDQTLVPFKPR